MVGLYISFQFGLRVPTTSIYTACRHYRSLLQLVDMLGVCHFRLRPIYRLSMLIFYVLLILPVNLFFNGSVISTILSILL